MHPVEHLYYYSCIGPSLLLFASPFAFMWNGIHLILSPAGVTFAETLKIFLQNVFHVGLPYILAHVPLTALTTLILKLYRNCSKLMTVTTLFFLTSLECFSAFIFVHKLCREVINVILSCPVGCSDI